MQYLHSSLKNKSIFALIAVVVSALLISFAYGRPMNDNESRDQLWKQVKTARGKGLPKTEMKLLQQIYEKAIQENDAPDAVRAMLQKIIAESMLNQPAAPFAIKKLRAQRQDVPPVMRPITDAVLADWMYSFFQNNRWRFHQRSQTSQPAGDDIETWDLRQILQEVDRSLVRALSHADQLKQIPIGQYARLTTGGNGEGDVRRPTVFDFVAHQAIDFYGLDEQITRGVDAFELAADSTVFGDDRQFIVWKPVTEDRESFHLKSIELYQRLMRFHQSDQDQTAYMAVDLQRIEFANRVAAGESKLVAYQNALQRFSDSNKRHPISTEALAKLAQSYMADQEMVKAHRVATVGLNRFAKSVGGDACHNLIELIEQKFASISTELIWNDADPDFEIRYKNIDKVKFRVVKFAADQWEKGFRLRVGGRGEKRQQELMRLPVVKQWEVDLPATDDYQMQKVNLRAPQDLAKGAYLIIGLVDAGQANGESRAQVMFAEQLWKTDLAHVSRVDYNLLKLQGQVVHATTGLPIVGAKVKVQAYDNENRRNRKLKTIANVVTDNEGMYQVMGNGSQHRLTIAHDDDVLYLKDDQYRGHQQQADRAVQRASFFTDRSIYRPGQTIHFKVVLASSHRGTNDYIVAARRPLEVALYDINNEVVDTIELMTNDLGSASGAFTAPADRATGRMRIQAMRTRFNGQAIVRVEEYKRPKFKVAIDKPKQSFALHDMVTATGHAMAYNGAAIDGAKVTYRVVRGVQYAPWWRWRCWWAPVNLPQQEIAQGTTETQTDGSFEIAFEAKPDSAADRDGLPVFTYTVSADVTDSAGETRSTQTQVNVGFVSLNATVEHDQWLTPQAPVELKVTTKTLDGVGQPATGTMIIRTLQAPQQVHKKTLDAYQPFQHHSAVRKSDVDKPDLSDYRRWPVGDVVHQQELKTDSQGQGAASFELQSGAFEAAFETTDVAGEKVTSVSRFLVVDPASKTFPVRVPDYFEVQKSSLQPGETFTAVWGTGYPSGSAYVEVTHRQKTVASYWTDTNATMKKIEIPITEEHRGGLQLSITYVRENRLYWRNKHIDVPWDNKRLQVKWEHFTSKLQPGGKETWTAVVSSPDAELSTVEMLAAMYDGSLDQFSPHHWAATLGEFYHDQQNRHLQFSNRLVSLDRLGKFRRAQRRRQSLSFRRLANEIALSHRGFGGGGFGGGVPRRAMRRGISADAFGALGGGGGDNLEVAAAPMMAMSKSSPGGLPQEVANESLAASGGGGTAKSSEPDLDQVSIRKNLQETAFFYPNLIADAQGRVRIEFEVPESLTTWKFMGMAHDAELRTGMLADEMTTSKDLMVQPNPPRFLRQGDEIYFSVKVTNRSQSNQTGVVQLQLNNALDETSVDAAFENVDSKKEFSIPAGASRSYHWRLKVPDLVGAVTYKAVGSSATVSDGEEGLLPVLSKQILVTESLPLPIRGNQTRTFRFEALEKMERSDTLKNQSLTVQMTSNPSWYAVMALPYLMEYPHQCSEQTFNRLYANALGHKIVNSNPRIEKIFQQWRGTDALKSPLEKNDDLRNAIVAESPWLVNGKNQSQAQRNVGLLFESNRIDQQIKKATLRLSQMQLPDGSWPWFSNGRSNKYLTLYITTGFGRLRKLGVGVDVSSAINALRFLDADMTQRYDALKQEELLDQNNLNATTAMYLYCRSFFLTDQSISDQDRPAFDYFVQQATDHWGKLNSRQSQGHVAIAMKRMKMDANAEAIMESLTQRSLRDDELGQYWNENPNFWFWYQAPIETQALMIEAYDEVMGDAEAIEECKIWLLKQKQTQAWKTTKSTADAVYALLLQGTNSLASSKLVEVSVGGQKIDPQQVEAGTGFFETKFTGGDIKSNLKTVEVVKSDDGIAWGSVHWQYLEDLSEIQPYDGTPLQVTKRLFVKKNTNDGPEIFPVDGPVEIGDQLVTRVEIRVDRDMEFVHLKDYRGSGTEPVNVLSQYRSRDGLWYYESTRDTASHFFIDYLRKGTYVFETSVRVQHAGNYETGVAEIQCMYAPEFNSHSQSVAIEVRTAQ
jgi:uncharacterized protein YfaS (alpha-2-macroglobulin family)